MTPLLTVAQLAVWAQRDIDDDDEFAIVVINAASLVVAEKAWHTDWLEIIAPALARVPAPARAVLIAIQLAKRTFMNPHAIVGEGAIGPIGGDRIVEDFARTLELTLVEITELEDLRPGASQFSSGNGLWTQPISTARPGITYATIYIPDGSDPLFPFPMGTVGVDDWAYTPIVP